MKEPTSDEKGRGIARDELQGKPQDPTGLDIMSVDSRGRNDQQMPAGGEGLEGGAAGKFTRAFRERGDSARPGGTSDLGSVRGAREEKS